VTPAQGEQRAVRRLGNSAAVLLAIACVACLPGPTPTSSGDEHGAASPTPAVTLGPTPTQWLTPTPTATQPSPVEVAVYFTDFEAYASATPPYEVPVTRLVPGDANLPEAALTEFFAGPTPEEEAQGLAAVTSGATGFSALEIQDGVARVYLTGSCNSGGATYTISCPIFANLLQFDEIEYVKIYDENGETEVPVGASNSIPFCLEP
jgi:hypothetical protein